MKEQNQKINIKQNAGGKNGRPGQGSRRKRKVSGSQSQMAVRKNQSVEAGQPETAAKDSGKEAKGRPILCGRRQAKWFAIALIMIAFIAFIALHFSKTPATTKADEIDFLALKQSLKQQQQQEQEQEQDLSTPVITEATPRIETIRISDSGKSSIYVQGKFAYEGDIVDGFKILKIHPNKVEFEKDGQTVVGVFPSGEN